LPFKHLAKYTIAKPFYMLQRLYKLIFWTGYSAVLITSMLYLPWDLDKVKVGTVHFNIRLDHLLHTVVYFLICMYFYVGQRNGLVLFHHKALRKFLILIFILATITEIVQLWVPYRSFNPMDWVSNLSGVIIGMAVMYISRRRAVVGSR
jgi:VanZ family protein